jgi:hypothetical protein
MINETDSRRFRNLVSTAQLVKKIAQHGYDGAYTEQAIYILLKKYGIEPKRLVGENHISIRRTLALVLTAIYSN